MSENEFISEVLACHYSFEECCILIGSVNSNQELIIHTEINLENMPVSKIGEQLLKYSLPVWANAHEPLKYELGAWLAGELDFNQEPIAGLDDLYKSLKAEGRIKAPGLRLMGEKSELCTKILVKALTPALCGKPQEFSVHMVERTSSVIGLINNFY